MNCKPGDLAVIVGGLVGGPNYGRVVTVIRVAEAMDAKGLPLEDKRGLLWVVDKELTWKNGVGEVRMLPLAFDSRLRPLRNNDGEDETLTWAGKPQSITTPEAA